MRPSFSRFGARAALCLLAIHAFAPTAPAAPLASALSASSLSAPQRRATQARTMLGRGWPASQVLNLLSLACPLAQGVPDPTCTEAYLLALQANAATDRNMDPLLDGSGETGADRLRARNAVWIDWLGVVGGSPAFDDYRLMAVAHYLEMSQPRRALLVLAPILPRLPLLAPADALRARYAELSGLLESADDDAAQTVAREIQSSGGMDPDFLRYVASHWLRRAPQRLDPWRAQFRPVQDRDILALLDNRENGAAPAPDAFTDKPQDDCCQRSRYVGPSLSWLADAQLRMLQGQALPSLRFVMQAMDMLLMAAPRAGTSAALWWQIQDSAWHDLQSVLALPEDDDALWRRAQADSDLAPAQLARFHELGWKDSTQALVRQQILLHLASRAADDGLRLRALQEAGVGRGDALFLYRLVAADPALLRALAGTPYPCTLLGQAALQSRVPAPDATEHPRLGAALSNMCPDLDLASYQTAEAAGAAIERQQDRVHALLILHFDEEAARIALHDLHQIRDRAGLDPRWREAALRLNLDVLRSMLANGKTEAAHTFASGTRELLATMPAVGSQAQRHAFEPVP
jgi:hypothetical protein